MPIFSPASWPSTAPTDANKLRTSYLKGFLDISGTSDAGLRVRNNKAIELFDESDAPKFQINATSFIIGDADNVGANLTVPINKLSYLSGLHTNVQNQFNSILGGSTIAESSKAQNAEINGNLKVGNQLVVSGNAYFQSNVNIAGSFRVGGDAFIDGNETIGKSLIVDGNISVLGNSYLLGDVSMSHCLYVQKCLNVIQDVSFNSYLSVAGNTKIGGDAVIVGKLTVSELIIGNNADDATGSGFLITTPLTATNTLNVSELATLNNGLSVTAGTTTLADQLTVSSNGIDVTGASTIRNKLTVSSGGMAVTGASSVAGKLTVSTGGMDVTGTSTLSDKLTVSSNGIDVTGASSVAGKLTVTSGGMAVTNGNTTLADKLIVQSNGIESTGASIVHGTMTVDNAATFSNKMSVAMDASFGATLHAVGIIRSGDATKSVFINGPHHNSSQYDNCISVLNGDLDIVPGENGNVNIRGGLSVDGPVNFLGDFIKTDVKVTVSEQFEVKANAMVPAAIVQQKGSGPIATFYDKDENMSIYVDRSGKVGIGAVGANKFNTTYPPNAELEVRGHSKISESLLVLGSSSFAAISSSGNANFNGPVYVGDNTHAITADFYGVTTFHNTVVLGSNFVDQW